MSVDSLRALGEVFLDGNVRVQTTPPTSIEGSPQVSLRFVFGDDSHWELLERIPITTKIEWTGTLHHYRVTSPRFDKRALVAMFVAGNESCSLVASFDAGDEDVLSQVNLAITFLAAASPSWLGNHLLADLLWLPGTNELPPEIIS